MVVLWNGSKDHPGGRQLFTEEYTTVSPRDVSSPATVRTITQLADAEIDAILGGYAHGERPWRLAEQFGVTTEDVQHLITAWQCGVLTKGDASAVRES